VDLIFLASGVEDGTGIFIPRLGVPIKIADVAQQLINEGRSGGEKAIAIAFTGLRAGDKMSEEFLSEDEVSEPTVDGRLFRVTDNKMLNDWFHLDMDDLSNNVRQRDLTALIETLCRIVPTYRPTELLRHAVARASA
jgi:FlaA1/EpsC-like NDP-sugar epimerase